MPSQFNNLETRHNSEASIQISAPYGLHNFSHLIVQKGLSQFQRDSLQTKIRVVPVAGMESGNVGATYSPLEDNIQLFVPMNLLMMFYTQKAFGDMDGFLSEVIPRLEDLSELALQSVGMDKKSIRRTVYKPTVKPEYRTETQQEYEVNNRYEIARKAIDIYCQFILAQDNDNTLKRTAQDTASLISFVHFIEEFLGNIPDEKVLERLSIAKDLPSSYTLLCFLFEKADPRTLELSNRLIDVLSGSVEHEKIHQILCHFHSKREKSIRDKKDLRFIEGKDIVDQDEGKPFDEQLELYRAHQERKSSCLKITLEVMENHKTLESVYPELKRLNLQGIREALQDVQPKQAQEGYALDFIQVGFQESAIAILTAQKEGIHFLAHLQQYISEYNCILPPLEVLQMMQLIAQKHSDNGKAAVNEIATTLYKDEDLYPHVEEIMHLLISQSQAHSD